jgi:hypothetical protein
MWCDAMKLGDTENEEIGVEWENEEERVGQTGIKSDQEEEGNT